jgi:hypothetical protein
MNRPGKFFLILTVSSGILASVGGQGQAKEGLPEFSGNFYFDAKNKSDLPVPPAVTPVLSQRQIRKAQVKQLVLEKIRTAPGILAAGLEVPADQDIYLHCSGQYFVPVAGLMKLVVTPLTMPRPYSLQKTVMFRANYKGYSGMIKCQVLMWGDNHGHIDECYAETHLTKGQDRMEEWPLPNYCSQQDRCGTRHYFNMMSFDNGQSDDLAVW